MHEQRSPIRFRTQEAPVSLNYGQRCHNGRQLVIGQLTLLRGEDDSEGVEHSVERPVPVEGSDDTLHVKVTSKDTQHAHVDIHDQEAGGYTRYDFDGDVGTFSSQAYSAEHQPLGAPTHFGEDAGGDAALAWLHTTLFAVNNAG